MFGKRIVRTFIGFLTCTIVVVFIMYLLWPTVDPEKQKLLVDIHDSIVEDHGFGGHFFVLLLMLLVVNIFIPFNFKIPLLNFGEYEINYALDSSGGFYFLILGVWLVGSFAGGLASRGGMRSGASSAILSFLFLDLIFSIQIAAMGFSMAGVSGFFLSIVAFILVIFVGSFVFVGIIGLVGGGIGGILGKMLFRKEKVSSTSSSESDE